MKCLLKVFATVMVAVLSVHGQSWVSGADGSWGVGANWSGAAVPSGTANLFFTNTHSGTLTVALDGSRTNAADLAFSNGAWSLNSGTPTDSELVLDGNRTLTVDSGSVVLAAPVVSQGTSVIMRRGGGSLAIEAPWNFLSGSTPAFEAGVTQISADGSIRTAADKDIRVDGSATLVVNGGEINTRIIRMGESVMTDGAVFRMNSGSVNCSGSGGAVLLIGYVAGTPGAGSARAEILGGTFAATGLVANAGICVGTRQPGTLVVNGTNGTPAVVNVGTIWMGWQDARYDYFNTNTFLIGSNALVTASQRVASVQSNPIGNILLQSGGVLRTPDVYATGGRVNFDFAGGTLEILAANSAGLFRGALMNVAVSKESTLEIGANDVLLTQRLNGAERLVVTGGGTLSFGGDQSGFSGTLERDSGTVLITNITGASNMRLELSGTAALHTGANAALDLNLVVDGNVSITSLVTDVVLSSVDLQGGTLTVANGLDLTFEGMQIPAGANATVYSSGHVVIGALSGGGTLTVAGGGSFDIIDKSALDTEGGSVTAAGGTTLDTAVSVLPKLSVGWNLTLSPHALLSVSNLNFYGGTLTIASGELAVENLTVFEGVACAIELQGSALVGSVESCAIAANGVFAVDPGVGNTLTVGALAGSGTLRLNGGTLSVGAISSGVHLDINDGSAVLTAAIAPVVPLWTSGEPAFWVDAAASGSLVAGSNLEWRDKRYSGGIYTMKATATGAQPMILAGELNGNSVVKFDSPSSSAPYKGMVWDQRLTNIRTVFWVIGAQEGGGMLLGDEGLIDFLRGEVAPYGWDDYPLNNPYTALFSTRYANANRDNLQDVRNGITRVNGAPYDSFQKGFPSPGYHVIATRTADDTVAKAFASERLTAAYYNRSGCQRIGEVLVFTNALTDAEMVDTENYLQKKWFGGDVTLASVRLGTASATLTAAGGGIRINTLELDAPGGDLLSAVSGVTKVERIEVGVNGYTLGDAVQRALPFNAAELRVKSGCTVTADLSLAASPYINQISGSGSVVVNATAELKVGGVVVAADEALTVAGNGSGLISDYLYTQDAVTFNDFSDVLIGRAYAYGNAVIDSEDAVDIAIGTLKAAGMLSLPSASEVYVDYLEMENLALQLDVAEGAALELKDVYGRNTLTKTGNGSVICSGSLKVDEHDFTLAANVFASIATVNHERKTFTVNGTGSIPINLYNANGNTTKTLTFGQGSTAVINTLKNFTGVNGRFYLRAYDAEALQIDNLYYEALKNMAFPVGQITTVANLSSVLGNQIYICGGTLNVTGSVVNVDRIVLLNEAGYSSEGLALPDNTTLSLDKFEARANVDALVDLGQNSVVTLNSGVLLETGAKVTFVNGTILLKTDMVSGTALRLQGTTVQVAAGATLSAPTLEGVGSLSVASGGTLNFLETYGFSGAIENQGGSVLIDSSRTNLVPLAPADAPAFWVDASQSGSLVTNGAGKLEWLDKRTVRDGTPGLNKATSLVRMPGIMQGELNGLPVVDFGTLGTSTTDERGMIWSTRYTDVQAVHWVIGAQNGGGQMLGDWNTGDIDYFRCSDTLAPTTPFNYGYADYRTPLWSGVKFATRGRIPNILNGETRMNGAFLAAPGLTNGFPSAGYHLLSLRATGSTWAGAFASERVNKNYGQRSGAQRLGEVLVYRRQLTPTEQQQNDAYLSVKWFDRILPGYRVLSAGLLSLSGSGTFSGTLVTADAITAGSGGIGIDGDLLLSYSAAAQSSGTLITVTELPATGEAVVSIGGDLTLADKGTVVLGELKPGVYTILEPTGTLVGAANVGNWQVETAAGINANGRKLELFVEDSDLKLRITASGTVIMVR